MNFFITGGAGFIGVHLVKTLLYLGEKITIYDNFSNSSKEKIYALIKKNANLIEGDILDKSKLYKSMNDHDIVVHLAAQIDIDESIKNPGFTQKVNVEGTLNVLNSCKKNNIKNFIGISSAAVYGNPKELPLEEKSPLLPISPYGQSKLNMEKEINNFSQENDLNSIILRLFNVYGKGQTETYAGVITKFINNIQNNEKLKIFGDGTFSRDFINVNDVVQGITRASENMNAKRGNVYNIASGTNFTISELAKLMLLISNKNLKIEYLPSKKGDISHSHANIELAKKDLGFKPKISLKDGLGDLLKKNNLC